MPLEVVPAVLSWNECSDLHADLRRRYEQLLAERLERLADAAPDPAFAGPVRALGPDARRRLLTAPEAAHRITYRPTLLASFLPDAVRAEKRRDGEAPDSPAAVWTALGDRYFPAPGGDASAPPRAFSWRAEDAMEAPRLAGTVPVDHFSPWAARPGKPVPLLDDAALRAVVGKLEEALRGVQAVRPAAHELITTYVRVVVLWSDGGPSLVQFSTERYVGRVVLSNVEAEAVDAVALASALVHEATHSFVYTLEEWDPIVPDRQGSVTVQVVSPWTGRKLGIHSFVQACCVWLSLWQFFKRALERGRFEARRVEEEMERSRAGFAKAGLDEAITVCTPHLSPTALALMRRMVDEARGGAYD
jgi:hypothetical protein